MTNEEKTAKMSQINNIINEPTSSNKIEKLLIAIMYQSIEQDEKIDIIYNKIKDMDEIDTRVQCLEIDRKAEKKLATGMAWVLSIITGVIGILKFAHKG